MKKETMLAVLMVALILVVAAQSVQIAGLDGALVQKVSAAGAGLSASAPGSSASASASSAASAPSMVGGC